MWFSFVLACVLCTALLYLPGFLVTISTGRMRWHDSIACAPLVGVAFYAVAAIVLAMMGTKASIFTVVLPLLLAGALLAFVRLIITAGRKRGSARRFPEAASEGNSLRHSLLPVALYLAAGVIVTGFVFVRNLDGAASMLQASDNGTHLNSIATFLDTGNYSPFLGSYYADAGAVSPFVEGAPSFYPRAWHELVALVVEVLDVPITLGVNAVNTVLLGVVYPLGMHSLLRRVFGARLRPLLMGAAACVAFPAGIIDFITFGPLYPLLLSYALAPAAVACFIDLLSPNASVSYRICRGALFATGCIAIALAQPSGIFLMAVLLAPYVVIRSCQAVHGCSDSRGRRVAVAVVASLAIAAIWLGIYSLPSFSGVVSFNWEANDSVAQAIVDVLLLSMSSHSAQPTLALFVFLGVIITARDPQRRPLLVPYCFFGLTYVLCSATEGDLKHLLGGFWYTDPHRIATNVSIAAVPLAVYGALFLYDCLLPAFERFHSRHPEFLTGRTAAVGTLVVLGLAAFCPSLNIRGYFAADTGFGAIARQIAEQNSREAANVLDGDESEFVEKALDIIPEGALIINSPNDGSVFAYALYGANIYYRAFALPSLEGEKGESIVIRDSLDDIATNDDVAEAVDKIGAQYVLLLDQGAADAFASVDDGETEEALDLEKRFLWSYYPDQWDGIEGITDETPGFEVVLSEGDMRLYRIVA